MVTDDAIEWRERSHDYLVFAVAVAAWQAERGPGFARHRGRGRPAGPDAVAVVDAGVVRSVTGRAAVWRAGTPVRAVE
jgi:hypothetical protein